MDTVQMENILKNLTNLEMSFRQLAPNLNYHDLNTYKRFLEHFFIREHRLESVYWPQLPEPASHSHRFLTSYTEIERLPLFRAGNIIMMKNPNLPFSHMLKNDFFQCIYMMEGGASLNLEHMEKSLEKGDFLILFPDVNHLLTPSESAIAINILIEKNQMYSKKYPILDCYAATDDKGVKRQLTSDDTEYLLLHTVENDDIRTIILKMFTEYLQSLDYKEEILESYLTLLFVYLMRY